MSALKRWAGKILPPKLQDKQRVAPHAGHVPWL